MKNSIAPFQNRLSERHQKPRFSPAIWHHILLTNV